MPPPWPGDRWLRDSPGGWRSSPSPKGWRSGPPGHPTAPASRTPPRWTGSASFSSATPGRAPSGGSPPALATTSSRPGRRTEGGSHSCGRRPTEASSSPTDINGWYQDGGDVWILELGTGAESKVVENAFGPSWAPDGRGLAFDATWAGPRRIWVADTTGRNPRQVTSDSSEAVIHAQARWSPDGRRLVFRRQDKSGADVAIAEPGAGSLVRLTADNMLDIDPAWSPDGRRIYLASNRGGGLNLWRIPVGADGRADGPAEQVTTGAGDDVEPAIAPDGRRVVFAVRGINADLWRLPVSPETGQATGQPTALLTDVPGGEPGYVVARRAPDRVQLGPHGGNEYLGARAGERRGTAGDPRRRRRLPTGLDAGRSGAGLLLRPRGQRRHLAGRGGRRKPGPAHRRPVARHQPVSLARRPIDRLSLRPQRAARGVGHGCPWPGTAAAHLGRRGRPLSALDRRRGGHHLPRRERRPDPDDAGRPRRWHADPAARCGERRAHVALPVAGSDHGRAGSQDAVGLSTGRPPRFAGLRIPRARRPHRLPDLVARRTLGAVDRAAPLGGDLWTMEGLE